MRRKEHLEHLEHFQGYTTYACAHACDYMRCEVFQVFLFLEEDRDRGDRGVEHFAVRGLSSVPTSVPSVPREVSP